MTQNGQVPAQPIDVETIPDLGALVAREMARDSTIYPNLGQDVFMVTADRIRLVLIKYKNTLKVRMSWQGLAGYSGKSERCLGDR